jgi:hypothetical protein
LISKGRVSEARAILQFASELAEQVLIGTKSEIGPLSSRWRRGALAD